MSDVRRVTVFWHEAVLAHDTGEGLWEAPPSELLAVQEPHPENGTRIRNMRSVLERGPLRDAIDWREGRLATRAELETVHDSAYVDSITDAAEAGGRRFDPTTVLSAASWEPLLAAAGTAIEAADRLLDGVVDIAYALVRPPGHHAQPAEADGYCFFNNVALAAQRARDRGLSRVAIVDWDVHHGNGTQACFYERDDVLTVSLHMRTGLWGPTHQQTGSPQEVGAHAGQGYNLNVELAVGSGDRAYELAFTDVVVPVLRQYGPELIIVACGQDASTFDGNGRQNVSMAGFHTLGRLIREAADELCDGRLLLVQEGGYAVTYAAFCLHSTLEGVLGRDALLQDPIAYIADDYGAARRSIDAVQSAVSRYWRFD